MSQKLVTIVGATGQQGEAVVKAFAGNPVYRIRGLTRNPDGEPAKKLAAQGIEVVKVDLDDLESTKAAFKDSAIVFAVTDFYGLFQKHGPQKAKEMEAQQGINMAKAASATPTLEHYIWSTLPRQSKDYPVYHFESKWSVNGVIKQDPALLAKTTFLMVCFYANNLQLASFRPYWIPTVKKYVQFTTYPETTSIPLIGSVSNVTPFVKAIIEQPDETKNGVMVIGAVGNWPAKEWVGKWAEAHGKEVQMIRVSRKDYDALFPHPRWSEEFALMMDYFEYVPIQEWVDEGTKILTAEHLKVVPAETLEEWAKTWEMPDASLNII